MDDRRRSRLVKIRELARRGVAGEQASARHLLAVLCPSDACQYGPCSGCRIHRCDDRSAAYEPPARPTFILS